MKAIFGTRGSVTGHGIVGLPRLKIPGAEELLGSAAQLVSGFTPLVYVAFGAVPLVALWLGRTRLGLYIRVAGEKPEAVEALGISVARVRYAASLICGLILIFSGGNPAEILGGCLLFGFADAVSLRLQMFGFPSYLVLTVPYGVALLVLFGLSYRNRPRLVRETLDTMRQALAAEPDRSHPEKDRSWNA